MERPDPIPASWYERNKTQVKLLQYLIYHLRKEGVVITPSRPPASPEAPVVRKPPSLIVYFD